MMEYTTSSQKHQWCCIKSQSLSASNVSIVRILSSNLTNKSETNALIYGGSELPFCIHKSCGHYLMKWPKWASLPIFSHPTSSWSGGNELPRVLSFDSATSWSSGNELEVLSLIPPFHEIVEWTSAGSELWFCQFLAVSSMHSVSLSTSGSGGIKLRIPGLFLLLHEVAETKLKTQGS